MATKHTPGPWGPMGPVDKPWELNQGTLEAAPGITIGSVTHTEPICRVSGYLQPLEANARLIAAAPELLEACELAEAVLAEHEQHDGDEPSRESEAAVACRAAIAKTKTEAPISDKPGGA